MEEPRKDPNAQEEQTPKFRGLYRNVNISVKALDTVIVICLLVIVVFLAIELQDPGFTITFDSRGGSDVAPQKQMYGELLTLPEDPTREGYAFTGWYRDYACQDPWNVETDTIVETTTLYAGWEKK